MGGTQPPLHYLALCSSWGIRVRRSGRPPIATTRVASPTGNNPLTFLGAFCSIIFGPEDAKGTLMASTPSKGLCSNLGKLRRRWAWPPGRPLDLLAKIGLRTIRIALSLPLKLNGFTAASLGRARLPFHGACSPPCTFSIFLMIDGVVASLPIKGSLCSSARRLHPNGSFSRDSQGGVPKLSRFGLPRLWAFITSRPELGLGQALNQTCSSHRELSNAVSHSCCRRRQEVDSRLFVVGSQTGNLTPGPSFAHKLGCRYPNGQCEAISDIYTSRPFQ